MDNLCTIYLVRHGESEGNIGKVVGGNPALTENGKKQAAKTAQKLKDVRFDAVFSSNLLRAKQTAEIIALEKKLAVETRDIIRERSYGSLDGTDADKFGELIREARANLGKLAGAVKFHNTYPEGVENNIDLASRMITFLREIASAYAGKTVLVVSHGGIMRAFLIHLGFGTYQNFKSMDIGNTAFVKIATDGVEFKILETDGIKIPA
ncbi:histidine phosphatase family protein [Patescibacteria group bacterium]|jgi:broad specificity phosphatase PhoE|nr:histidine phosphatase family protein [Patescibacteria group bacterium]MCL5114187.1 histidine phosphatase family protein [Patescibacteria group bacterium]